MMKILRLIQKLFRRDPLPNIKFLPNPEIEKKYNTKFQIEIHTVKQYDRQSNQVISPLDKIRIRSLINDIKSGFVYIDGRSGGNTHFLADYSHEVPPQHVLSKEINRKDRLNYRLLKPTLRQLPNGTFKYSMVVILESCIGHKLNGTPDYWEDKDYAKMKRLKNTRNRI